MTDTKRLSEAEPSSDTTQDPSEPISDHAPSGKEAKTPFRTPPPARKGAPPRSKEDYARQGQPGQRPRGATAALIELDHDLMKLLVRRATLVSRIRGGRDHASTPAAIQAEKAVRIAWETGALAFSKDPRFIRQLFTLLQDLKVLSKDQATAHGNFNLAPSKAPVKAVITGPQAVRAAQMRIALAACLGKPLALDSLMLPGAVMDTIKACLQAGAVVSHAERGSTGHVRLPEGKPLSFADAGIFAGDDLLTLYLAAFLSAGSPGILRLTGGSRLKSEDLTALRQTLPLFGARLAHTIPHSRSLPATIERSGIIPPLVVVPPELPFEGLCALLLAPLVWNTPVTLNLAGLPAATATAALAEVRPLHRDCGADVETHGPHLVFQPSELTPPEAPQLPLDPVLSAYLLAIPAFTGGSFTLKGAWPGTMPGARKAEQLLAWAGLSLDITAETVCASSGAAAFSQAPQLNDLGPDLGPLFLALAAKAQTTAGQPLFLESLAPFPQEDTETALANDFFARLGLELLAGTLAPLSGEKETAPAWASPDAFWSMAYALAAFIRPGLQLANPSLLNEVMPVFWAIYNGLPSPSDPTVPSQRKNVPDKDPADDKPARRRIIAD